MFQAAQDTDYTAFWDVFKSTSPDNELMHGDTLAKLWSRSRTLIKDNPVAAGAQQAYINFILGGDLAVKSNSTSKRQRAQIKEFLTVQLEKLDITGQMSLSQMVEGIISSSFQDGDVLINLPIDSRRKGVKTVVELIEANRIQTPGDLATKNSISPEDNLVRLGVQYDTEGRVQGYWVKKRNYVASGITSKEAFDFYPMYRESNGYRRKVTWLFKAPLNNRPQASRQYPVMTPVIMLFKYLQDYKEAVLIGARVAACFSAFVKTANPAGAFKTLTTEAGRTTSNPTSERRITRLQPGTVTYLKPTEEVTFAAPNRPGDNVDPFIVRLYKTIAMYLRIPYEIIFMDLSETNYSSWRGGALEAKKMANRWRRELTRVIRWVVSTLVLEGMLNNELLGSIVDAKLVIRWPSNGILDPEKEARGDKLRLENGTVSKQMIAEEQGLDYEELREEIEAEALMELDFKARMLARKKELEEKYGVLIADESEGQPQDRDTSSSRRAGEQGGSDIDEEDAKDRRKNDGNW